MALINFSGLASGIDSSSLIQAVLEQQRSFRIKPLENQISTLTDTNTAFDDITTKANALKETVEKFRAISGSVLSKVASSSSESRVTATASNSATNGSYAVTVNALAKNGNFSFDDRFSSSTATINSSINNGAVAADRTVTVQTGTGADQETVQIELTNTTTLSDFVNQYNSASSKSEATLVNVGTTGSPSYAVVINSLNQGTAKGQLSVSVGSEITSAGSGAFSGQTLDQASNAQFAISGISGTFTRDTNTITDAISGVTFNLQSTGSATVTIADDSSVTTQSIQDFVDAYNELRKYIADNDAVTQDEEDQSNIFGSLTGTSIDDNLLSSIRSAFSSSALSGELVNTLADLGVTTQRDGSLKFDSTVFQTSLASDPESVRTIALNLGETLGGINGTLAQYTRFNGLIDQAQSSNQTQIDNLNTRMAEIEKALSSQQSDLQAQFARLESLVGKLNSQQTALAGLTTG